MSPHENPSRPNKISKNNRRLLRNYLLDPQLQLRFTAYVSCVTACASILLGAFLWHTSGALVRETELAVEARSQAIQSSHSLSMAAFNNELMQHYDDPVLRSAFQERTQLLDEKLKKEKSATMAQQQHILREQRAMAWGLIIGLATFFLLVALGTIIITHRVAGPIYRIKRTMQDVGNGQLIDPIRLRKGDQVRDLFEEMEKMVRSLRNSRLAQRQKIDAALELHKNGQWEEVLQKLTELQKSLEETRQEG